MNLQGVGFMKKIKYILIVLTVVAMLPIMTFAKEKINVYLFKRDGCGFCANALAFFNTLNEDTEFKDYFNLVVKDVSSKENDLLLERTAKKFDVTVNGVPFIVIGDQYFEGYVNSYDEQIKNAIKVAYDNESQDIVSFVLENKDDNSSQLLLLFF